MLRPFPAAAAAAAACLVALATPASAAVGQVITSPTNIDVSGVGHVRTLPCQGRAVAITGSEHKITLTGVCRSLQLSGVDNEVTLAIEPNGALAVTGSDQTVRWRSTGEPTQTFSGVDNDITRLDGQ